MMQTRRERCRAAFKEINIKRITIFIWPFETTRAADKKAQAETTKKGPPKGPFR